MAIAIKYIFSYFKTFVIVSAQFSNATYRSGDFFKLYWAELEIPAILF